jgi:hypothetical protein
MPSRTLVSLPAVLFCLLAACEEPKKAEPTTPSAAPVATPTTPPAPAAPTADKPKLREPLKVTDLELTDARREKIEKAVPEAKGFVEATSLEKDLQKTKIKDDDEKLAAKAFDPAAKGKWILFRGNITTMKPDSFELAVTFKPMMPGDSMGMSRKFFLVEFTDVKGYDMSALKGGDYVVVLAKYTGGKKATPGYDLNALGNW